MASSYKDANNPFEGLGNKFKSDAKSYRQSIEVLSQPVGSVTSRDQIINPAQYVDPSMYDDNRHGRLQYETDLKAAQFYAEMQEAAYKEWYDSEAQQIARQRAAGLNPDLLGVEAGSSADVAPDSSVPGTNIPTGDQMALQTASTVLNGLGSVMSVFSGVAGIMNTVSQIGLQGAQKTLVNNQADLVKQQADGQYLSNISSFVNQSSSALTDMLAKAMESEDFDIDKFYTGDFSNLLSLAPSDDPRYKTAFDRVLNQSQKTHSDAYKQLGDREEYRKKYLSSKASSYYSFSDDEMIGQLEIIVQAQEDLNKLIIDTQAELQNVSKEFYSSLDGQSAADSINSSNNYKDEYYTALDGQLNAKIDNALKASNAIIQRASAGVYQYLFDQFNSSDIDPARKQRIGWFILSGAKMGWQDYLAASSKEGFATMIASVMAQTGRAVSESAIDLGNLYVNQQNANTNEARQETDALVGAVNAFTGAPRPR